MDSTVISDFDTYPKYFVDGQSNAEYNAEGHWNAEYNSDVQTKPLF